MKKQHFALIALLVLMAVALTGCGGGGGAKLNGTWELTAIDGGAAMEGLDSAALEMLKALGGSIKFEFTDTEMSMVTTMMGETEKDTAKYTLDGNTIVLEGEEKLAFTIDGNKLTVSQDGASMVFTKVN